jgi:hypothetical protein
MTSIEQTSAATETPQAVQPSANSTVSTPTAAAPVKKAVKAPAKKAVAPAKPVVNPLPQNTAVKPVAKTAAKAVTKPVAKTAPTVTDKPAAKAPAKAQTKAATASTAKPKTEKLLKAKKPKLVRDSFTIPKLEYLILEELKHRSGKLGNSIKKSELIRAGIKALAAMSDSNFMAALKVVPAIKTGRPAKD